MRFWRVLRLVGQFCVGLSAFLADFAVSVAGVWSVGGVNGCDSGRL